MGLFDSFKKSSSKSEVSHTVATSLSDARKRAEVIINSVDDAVILINNELHIVEFNPAAQRITGWILEEAVGLDYRSVVTFVDEKGLALDEALHPVNVTMQSGQPHKDNTLTLRQKDGNILGIDTTITPLSDEQGAISAIVVVIRDVDDRRREDKQRADFISTASHEMRTPVAAIEGYLSLALNEKVATVDERARDFLEKARSSTSHLGKLFQDLLTSAKAEDGRLTNHPSIVEMCEFTEHLVEDLRFTAEKKGLGLELLVGGQQDQSADDEQRKQLHPLLYVHVDPDRIREVITNLFDNAVKYTDSGKVTVGITGDAEVVQFHISDTGPGIPNSDLAHLFQKFYRVDNSETRTKSGTGLGLYICRKIVELYKGRIWVESELEKGSTFYINLPRVQNDQARRMIEESKEKVDT